MGSFIELESDLELSNRTYRYKDGSLIELKCSCIELKSYL